MKKIISAVLVVFTATNFYAAYKIHAQESAHGEVTYSLNGRPADKIINILQNAHQFAYFAVYTITRQDIADALIAAKLRGVDVRGISDSGQASSVPSQKSTIKKLEKYGIPIELPQKEKGLMHIKMLITDNAYASGSFNWTYSAGEYNDDILETGNSEILRNKYLQIFKLLFSKYKNYAKN